MGQYSSTKKTTAMNAALVLLAICTTALCMPKPPKPGRPKPSPSTPDNSGYEEYRNRSIEENANQSENVFYYRVMYA